VAKQKINDRKCQEGRDPLLPRSSSRRQTEQPGVGGTEEHEAGARSGLEIRPQRKVPAMYNRETQICDPSKQAGKVPKLHEGSCPYLQVCQSLAVGKGPHQVDTTEMAASRPHRTQVGSQRLLYGNLL